MRRFAHQTVGKLGLKRTQFLAGYSLVELAYSSFGSIVETVTVHEPVSSQSGSRPEILVWAKYFFGVGGSGSGAGVGIENFICEHRNRLTNATFSEPADVVISITKTVDYTYDVFNRLVRKKVVANSVTTNLFLTGYEGINPTLPFDGTATTDVSNRFLWGPLVDQLFADERVLSNGVSFTDAIVRVAPVVQLARFCLTAAHLRGLRWLHFRAT